MCAAKCKPFERCTYKNKLIKCLINILINIQPKELFYCLNLGGGETYETWEGDRQPNPVGNVSVYSAQFHVQSLTESLSKALETSGLELDLERWYIW